MRTGSITVSGGTGSKTETHLPYGTYYVYELAGENGTPIDSGSYGVRRQLNDTVYQVTGSGTSAEVSEASSYTTLTNNEETVNVQVIKNWLDNNNEKGKRPESLVVTLSNHRQVTLNDENEWSVTISDLPKYTASGTLISYTWTEAMVGNGYAWLGTNTDIRTETDGTTTELTTFSNGPDEHYNPKTSFSGTKTWQDDGSIRPGEIVVILYKGEGDNKQEVERKTLDKPENAADPWEYEFTNLPVFDENGNIIHYSVEEVLPDGYVCAVNTETSVNPNYERDPDRDSVFVNEPNANMTIFSTGYNLGFIVMKHGKDFIIWTPRKASEAEIAAIKEKVAGHENAIGDQEFSQIMSKGHTNVYGVPSNDIKKGNMTASIYMDGDEVKVDFGNKNWSQLAWGQLAYTYTPGRTDLINKQEITDFEFDKRWLGMLGEEIDWDQDIQVTVQRKNADGSPDSEFSLVYSVSRSAVEAALSSGKAEFTTVGGEATKPKLKLSITTEGDKKHYSFRVDGLAYADSAGGLYEYFVKETNETLEGYLAPRYSNIISPTNADAAYDQGTIINPQAGGVALPATGGRGTNRIYLLGIMLTGFAGGRLMMKKKRRRKAT